MKASLDTDGRKITVVRLVHPANTYLPTLVVLNSCGSVMEVRAVQFPKRNLPMVVTVLGRDKDVSLMQPEKALIPILINPWGRMTEVKF